MNAPAPTPAINNNKRRGFLLIRITAVLILLVGAYLIWWFTIGNKFESTDDAYAAGNVVQVTPQVAGTVVAIQADDTDQVQAGKPLIELDKADAKVALEQAEAQLAQTVREVSVLYANNSTLAANVTVRQADVDKAKSDLARRQQLLASGAVSTEEVDHARKALQSAEAALVAVREQLASNHVLTDKTKVAEHPNVLRAAAHVRETYLAYARTSLPAPVSGYIAKRSVQIGQRVNAGSPLLAIVPLETLWVDANFKEVQLEHMRIGQDVTLHSDLYGSSFEYHGKVAGLSAGTGAAFSLLPAQNASGNWIKVVQRVPVRISLDPKELQDHPLRIGLSMQVKVNIAHEEGKPLTASARTTPAYQTTVFDQAEKDSEQKIAQIVSANMTNTAH